jgi:hypothetical protein
MHQDTFFLAHAQNNAKQTRRVTCSILIGYFINRVIIESASQSHPLWYGSNLVYQLRLIFIFPRN